MALKDYLSSQTLGVLASYQGDSILHYVGVVYPRLNNQLRVFIPKGHSLNIGSLVTIHLDNRTGVDELDAELRVYRTSYKGKVVNTDENWVILEPLEFTLVHGVSPVETYMGKGFDYPNDIRVEQELEITPLQSLGAVQEKEHHNKVGILTTLAMEQPHTTVLAFLNTEIDDVFLISVPNTFKLKQLKRNTHCFFTIDERAKFTFESTIDWNYTILEMHAYQVPTSLPLYQEVRNAFVAKNPFETGFFLIEGLEMIHLKCKSVVFSGDAIDLIA